MKKRRGREVDNDEREEERVEKEEEKEKEEEENRYVGDRGEGNERVKKKSTRPGRGGELKD